MPSAPSKMSAKISLLIVLIPICAIAWYAAPLLLPMWRWQHMQFDVLAKKLGVSETSLQQQVKVTIRHAPRGDQDPVPWQLVTTEPAREDEDHLLIRAVIIGDRDGQPVSAFNLGSGSFKDRYYTATAWRFPAGTFSTLNQKRPVVVFDAFSLEKVDTSKAIYWDAELRDRLWENDDEDVDDGWTGPASE
jgi:hypothetical protein